MAKYLGAVQIAECPRCGDKMPAKDLRKDGDNPALLVCRSCYDPPHPADLPFAPRANEGKPRWPIAPELLPNPVASTLTFAANQLSWPQFSSPADMIVRYEVWESIDLAPQEVPPTAPNALVSTIVPALNLNTGVMVYGSPFAYDPTLRVPATPGTYYVRAQVRGYTALGALATTNTIEQPVVVL